MKAFIPALHRILILCKDHNYLFPVIPVAGLGKNMVNVVEVIQVKRGQGMQVQVGVASR